jgi:aspartate-semialdehyde dehydrogenase
VQPVWLRGYVTSISRKKFLSAADELICCFRRSVGKEIAFNGKTTIVVGMQTADMKGIALFSAGGETSLEWAPKFAAGTTVIDNSSA